MPGLLQIVFQVNQDQAQPRAQMVTRDDAGKEVPVEQVEVAKKPYQFLWVSILREYLAFEFKPEGPLSFEWDQERVYDDFGTCCPSACRPCQDASINAQRIGQPAFRYCLQPSTSVVLLNRPTQGFNDLELSCIACWLC